MIDIIVGNPTYVKKSAKSMFVRFPYSLELLAKIKSLPVRYYISESRSWEVPVEGINELLQVFDGEEINISCDAVITPEVEDEKPKTVNNPVSSGVDFKFKTTPYEHQIATMKFAESRSSFLLGDEPGLGKTKQAIDVAIQRKLRDGFKHCLIICLNTLKGNWLQEVGIHSDEKAHIVGSRINRKGKRVEGSTEERIADIQSNRDEFFLVTNVESLRDPRKWNKDTKKYDPLKGVAAKQFELLTAVSKLCEDGTIGMIVIDEVHKYANPKSQQGKALKMLKAHYKLPMTGTPIVNRPTDAFSILSWIGAETRGQYMFEKEYCIFGGFGGKEIVDYRNLDKLQKIIDRNMIRRKKGDALDLPPKTEVTEILEMSADQHKLYREINAGVVADADRIKSVPNPLAMLTRLRQVTSLPTIIRESVTSNAKFDRMKDIVEEAAANNRKVIVYSNWSEVTRAAKIALADFNPAYIDGDVKNRMDQVTKFQGDAKCSVIVGTIAAMGTGLTLTAATTVLYLDRPWTKAGVDQANDRAHRIGTTSNVTAITLVCDNTIDAIVEEIITKKGIMSDALVDGDASSLKKLGVDIDKILKDLSDL